MAPEFEKVELAGGRAVLYRADCLELLAAGMLTPCAAIVSDPPYGIGYQHGGGGGGGSGSVKLATTFTGKIIGDDRPFDPAPWVAAAPKSKSEESRIVLWGADHYMQDLPRSGSLLAWDKHVGQGGDDGFTDCEWAWCGIKVKREVFRHLWKGVIAKKSADDCVPRQGNQGAGASRFRRIHVSQKPVELMRWCIAKVRPQIDGVIVDPYMGSGSTGIAALSLGYRFTGVEIDPSHFDTACKRIAAWWAEHGTDAR